MVNIASEGFKSLMESSDIHDNDKAQKWQLDTHQTKISDENSDLSLLLWQTKERVSSRGS